MRLSGWAVVLVAFGASAPACWRSAGSAVASEAAGGTSGEGGDHAAGSGGTAGGVGGTAGGGGTAGVGGGTAASGDGAEGGACRARWTPDLYRQRYDHRNAPAWPPGRRT